MANRSPATESDKADLKFCRRPLYPPHHPQNSEACGVVSASFLGATRGGRLYDSWSLLCGSFLSSENL